MNCVNLNPKSSIDSTPVNIAMDTTPSTVFYNFDDFFVAIFEINLVKRKLPKSSFELQYVYLVSLGAVSVFIQALAILMGFKKILQHPNWKLSDISEIGALGTAFLIAFCRGATLIVQRKEVQRLLQNLEKIYPQTEREQLEHNLQSYAKGVILRNKVTKILITLCTFAFLLKPILQSSIVRVFRGERYPFLYPFFSWYPFDDKQLLAYLFVYSYEIVTSVTAALFLFNEEVIFSISVTQLCMHYRHLSEMLSQLDARSESQNYQKLRKLIQYQYALENLRNEVNNIFSMSTFIGFSIIKISHCMFLYSLFHGIDIINMLPFMLGFLTLVVPVYLRCRNGNNLYEASASLIYAIYDHNWYEGTPNYRKMIAIMMIRANRPVVLQASQLNQIDMTYLKEVIIQVYQFVMYLHSFSN